MPSREMLWALNQFPVLIYGMMSRIVESSNRGLNPDKAASFFLGVRRTNDMPTEIIQTAKVPLLV